MKKTVLIFILFIIGFNQSFAFDFSNLTTNGSSSGNGTTNLYDMQFSSDGTKIFYYDWSTGVNEYGLSTPYNLDTRSAILNTFKDESAGRSHYITDDGTTLFIVAGTNNIKKYNLPTPWSLSTVNLLQTDTTYKTLYTYSSSNVFGFTFTPDGLKMYVNDVNAGKVIEYGLSSSFNLTTLSLIQTHSFGAGISDIIFSPNGLELFIGWHSPQRIIHYSLSSPYDITTKILETNQSGIGYYRTGAFNGDFSEFHHAIVGNTITNYFTNDSILPPPTETITNSGSRVALPNGFELNNFEVTRTGNMDFTVYDETDMVFIPTGFESIVSSGMLNSPISYSYFGEGFFEPEHDYTINWFYLDSELDPFYGSEFFISLGNYLVVENGTGSFNGAGFNVGGIEVNQTGSIEFEITDINLNVVWTGSANISANIPSEFNYIFTDGTLNPNSEYNYSWKYNINDTIYDLGDDSFITEDNLYYNIDIGEDCPQGLDTYVNIEPPYKICIQTNEESLGIFYPLINTVSDTGETTFQNEINDLENLYGTGTVIMTFNVGSIEINGGGLDENCNPIFDEFGNFNYIKGGTPSTFVNDLNTGSAFILGERWEVKIYGINLIGWAYDFIDWTLSKIQIIFGKILTVLFDVFDDYISSLRVPAREQNYCFLGTNFYLETNLTSYYSYHQQKEITIEGKNLIELVVLAILGLFSLFYINKHI